MNCTQKLGISSRQTKDFLLKYGIYGVFIVLIVFFSISNPSFLTFDNILLMLQQLSPFGIAVIGLTFVLITGGIDISVGRVMFVSCVVVGEILSVLPPAIMESPLLYLICFGVVIVFGGAFGFFNGILIAKFKIAPFLATLVSGYIARGVGLSIAGITKYDVSVISPISNGRVAGIPIVTIVFLVLVAIMHFVLRRTQFGKHTMAIGNNRTAAKQIGINVDRHLIFVYIISGVAAAIGGLLSAGQISEVYTTFGENNEFQIISAAVIGGTSLFGGKGSVFPGAIIGVLLIQIVLNGLSMLNASVYIYNMVRGLIIFVAVMLDSVNNKGELR